MVTQGAFSRKSRAIREEGEDSGFPESLTQLSGEWERIGDDMMWIARLRAMRMVKQ
jgi:hypothetical protein